MIRWLISFAAAFVAACSAGETTPLLISADTVGLPRSNAEAELFQPAGRGPFPAMVVLHGCDGIGRHYRLWAQQLADWGYETLLVDSFRPRGVQAVCNHGRVIPPELQAADAFAAADYLRSRTDVTPERIGVIGFSHGGWAVLKAVLSGAAAQARSHPFAAAVAFYPGCERPDSPLVTDTLILIGGADDWTPPGRCVAWRQDVDSAGHTVQIKIYPNALHGFDSPSPPRVYAGHHVGRDPAAAEDAVAMTRGFLAQRLAPSPGSGP